MRSRVSCRLLAAPLLSILVLSGSTLRADAPPVVRGDYVEARTCDVWTGPCFANGEINLTGDHGVMAWSVNEGSWKGVRLDGLKVAAVLDAEGTLGTNAEGKVRAVLYVDEAASEAQELALVAMAKSLAPKYLADIVSVHRRRIEFGRSAALAAELTIGKGEVAVATTALCPKCDTHCGNEEKAYPSLARTVKAECAKTLAHSYSGDSLGVRWSAPGARSAMLGRFEI